jgi:predicted dehydrogenase
MKNNEEGQTREMTRRRFTAAACGAPVVVRPWQVRGSGANSAVRIGLLGCGARGRVVADAFLSHPNARITALADLFADNLEQTRAHFDQAAAKKGHAGIDKKHTFLGPEAFREIAQCPAVDMVHISTPDYFHPEHLEAAVAAGKHVYCEKPAAVDVEGCLRFIEIGKKAQGRLSLDVGFNVRSSRPFREIVRRIHAGELGRVATITSHYHAPKISYPDRGRVSPLERRIRNFYWDRILSGDVLVDQNVHMIDICNWALGAHPVMAVGKGGRKVRDDWGDIWDHWSVTFTYPGDVLMTFHSVQFGETYWDVGCRFFGDRGVAECYYSGEARVIGPESWDLRTVPGQEGGGETAGRFQGLSGADESKTGRFLESILSGRYMNEAESGAMSALSAILGREAAYAGRAMTWEELIRSGQSYAGSIDLKTL